LKGEIPVDTPLDSLKFSMDDIALDSINAQPTEAEKKLSDKLRSDMATPSDKSEQLILFASPVTGVISQKFDKKRHPGIDVVTEADRAVKACLGGTVIYSAYSRKDGYVLIIDHGNGFLSVYKHNKRALKEAGAKVKLGDPIAIVGNTGENSSGPHLHFELWLEQTPVNPKDYISFNR
jgi:murein DD-endopeptidase MepM/ murein hydrolase activator NlpD